MNLIDKFKMTVAIYFMSTWFENVVVERDDDENVLSMTFCKEGSEHLIEEEDSESPPRGDKEDSHDRATRSKN